MGLNFFEAPIAAADVAQGTFIPRVSRETLPVAVAALGALVMPYNVFFQSSVISARPRDTSSDAKKSTLLRYMRIENFLVLTLAFVINLFVICVFADGFYGVLSGDEVREGGIGLFMPHCGASCMSSSINTRPGSLR